MDRESGKKAGLYRMVMAEHLCPFGLKSKFLLRRKGYEVEDHHLTTREETDRFKAEHNVDTTPQTFIGGERIGGYDELRVHFGLDDPDDETSYQPVIAIFGVALLMAVAMMAFFNHAILSLVTLEKFVAIAMILLGIQKLQDLESFSTMFLNYDLLAQRQVAYGYLYPFGETLAGLLMLASVWIWLAAPVALFIGSVGAFSVIKAVYIDRRELKCACVGGNSNVPLGFVSLTENLIMIAMGLWMPFRMYVM